MLPLMRDDMKTMRALLYAVLIGSFPFFFLLHWNGMFSFTYWWLLERINGTQSFLPQVIAAFLSAVIIYSVPVLLFELIVRLGANRSHPKKESTEPTDFARSGTFPVGMIILCVYISYSLLNSLEGVLLPSMFFWTVCLW